MEIAIGRQSGSHFNVGEIVKVVGYDHLFIVAYHYLDGRLVLVDGQQDLRVFDRNDVTKFAWHFTDVLNLQEAGFLQN